ncbi:hypothetical protein HMPREF9441_00917 [Paraprevotella clara YIT 11840]|uniref:Uncharacterized protein n=1 Tax=Paraprevotella clara YIT 11840 TaxID=762968 RepID=G5SNI8_9BACT|nr:hypothetical protein HMPREF9441_00917 [Paraprevotella clara YIT 11840]
MKDANPFPRKLLEGWAGKCYPPFLCSFSRLPQNEKSFTAKRKIVLL